MDIKVSKSAEETKELGKKFANELKPGDLILLKGDIGTGKTTFVQGMTEGLGGRKIPNSPSFTIMQEYETSCGMFRHLDLYRLDNLTLDVDRIGLPEILSDPQAITVIEWAERLTVVPDKKNIEVNFNIGKNENERIIEFHL